MPTTILSVPRAPEGFARSRMTLGLADRGHRGRRRAQPVHQPQPAARRCAPGAASPRRLLLLLRLADGRAARARCLAAWNGRSSRELDQLAKDALTLYTPRSARPFAQDGVGLEERSGGSPSRLAAWRGSKAAGGERMCLVGRLAHLRAPPRWSHGRWVSRSGARARERERRAREHA